MFNNLKKCSKLIKVMSVSKTTANKLLTETCDDLHLTLALILPSFHHWTASRIFLCKSQKGKKTSVPINTSSTLEGATQKVKGCVMCSYQGNGPRGCQSRWMTWNITWQYSRETSRKSHHCNVELHPSKRQQYFQFKSFILWFILNLFLQLDPENGDNLKLHLGPS